MDDPAERTRSLEPQILDYGTVQNRLMPLVATAYALNFTAQFMMSLAAPPGLADKGDLEDEDEDYDDDNDEGAKSGAKSRRIEAQQQQEGVGEEEEEVDLKDVHATYVAWPQWWTALAAFGFDFDFDFVP